MPLPDMCARATAKLKSGRNASIRVAGGPGAAGLEGWNALKAGTLATVSYAPDELEG